MAALIVKRMARSMDAAAKAALAEHGKVVTLRTLTRRYKARLPDLELAEMRKRALVCEPGDFPQYVLMVPHEWEATVHLADRRASQSAAFAALAKEMIPPDVALHRNRRAGRPLLFHLWHPAELAVLFRAALDLGDPVLS